ncbi:MAG: glycosyltransferase family 2 protein [Flavobacteriales bacterium]|nr:glycosyltransferase family 2 protein [Flavobacteriales bacterium]
MKDNNLYSVIIPVYNSELIVENTVNQTLKSFEDFQLRCEIILINDGSTDHSWQKIKELAINNAEVSSINLLKNYGQHTAVLCGIQEAKGDYLITIDDDLQNPPSEIIKLINKIKEGYDLVFAKFPVKKHSMYRRFGTKIISYLNSKIFHKPKDITLTNFRIFTKEVAHRVSSYNTFYPYIPGLLLMFSPSIANQEAEHHEREIGQSNYSFIKIIQLVSRLLFNYSSYPLKILTGIGFVIATLSFLIGTFFVLRGLLIGSSVEGWTTLVVLLSFFNGFLIIMLGTLGEYVSRILNQLSVQNAFQIKEIVE